MEMIEVASYVTQRCLDIDREIDWQQINGQRHRARG